MSKTDKVVKIKEDTQSPEGIVGELVNETVEIVKDLDAQKKAAGDTSYVTLPEIVAEKKKRNLALIVDEPQPPIVDYHKPSKGLGFSPVFEHVVVEEAPTDRQIKNAERVLKAAGRDPDSLISEAVADAVMRVQAQGTFMYEGVLQDPIETGLKVDYNRIRSQHLETPFYLPHPISQLYTDKVFSLYRLRAGDVEAYYLLDSNSTVSVGGGDARLDYHRRQNVPNRGVLVLINSSSNDDIVLGESTLINTESAYNLLNNAVLACTKEHDPNYPRGFGHMSDEPTPVSKEVKERFNVRECLFKRTSVFNSSISKGEYRDSQVHDSQISSAGYVQVGTCQIFDCHIRGTRVTLKGNHLTKCGVNSEGELLLKYSRFTGAHIKANSIYIPNKFCYLEIDTPQHKMYMVRATRRDFDLGVNLHNMERLRLDAPKEEIEKVVACQLSLDPEGFYTQPTSLSRSVASYLTDSITSRLKVVRLLDEAKQLVREVGDRTRPWDDIYAV
jgi:hypothetical protein